MINTVGVDVGTGAVKAVLFEVDGDNNTMITKRTERIRKRDPFKLAEDTFHVVVEEAGLKPDDIAYVATTGEGESLDFHTGHFYSMTTHARGAIHLDPTTRSVLDVGALHGRAIRIDAGGKVLEYRMTSQCASGTGQFLENIARYLGVAVEEVGELSQKGDDPEVVSSICAVLAETDVINMVSRSISSANILKGIHISMAQRLLKLLRATKVVDGAVMVTGGLATDTGLIAAMAKGVTDPKNKINVTIKSHPDSIYAGAIGAAIWGGFRHQKLAQLGQLPKAS